MIHSLFLSFSDCDLWLDCGVNILLVKFDAISFELEIFISLLCNGINRLLIVFIWLLMVRSFSMVCFCKRLKLWAKLY